MNERTRPGKSLNRALLVVDLQNDFCEGGVLGVSGGASLAKRVSSYLEREGQSYVVVVASKDWHTPHTDNGGHFSAEDREPDLISTWPPHCLAGSRGAEYHDNFSQDHVTHHIRKGQGSAGYSVFEGLSENGESLSELLRAARVSSVDVVGIATEHCVRATALDAIRGGFSVTVIPELIAAVNVFSGESALRELVSKGVNLRPLVP